MRLRELAIDRLPGIERPYRLGSGELDHAFVLIEGPNGSGKSSIGRAIRALLWPEASKHEPALRLRARVVLGERGEASRASDRADAGSDVDRDAADGAGESADAREALVIEREGRRASCVDASGQAVEIDLPAPQVAGCYVLGVRDLIAHEADDGEALRRELQRRLAGGYDLDAQLQELAPRARPGQHEARELAKARDHEGTVLRQQAALAREADALVDFRRRRDALASTRRRAKALELAIEARRCRGELAPVTAELADFADGMALLDGGEVERLEEILEDQRELEERRDRVAAQRGKLAGKRARFGEVAALSDAAVQRRRQQARALDELAADYAQARRELARAQVEAREARRRLDPELAQAAPFELEIAAVDEIASYVDERNALDAARRHAEDWRARLDASRPKADRGASQGPWLIAWFAAAALVLAAVLLGVFVHAACFALAALGLALFELGRRARARVGDALRQAFDARREHEVERLDAELARLRREAETLDHRGRELHGRLGIDADIGAPSTVELASRIAKFRTRDAARVVAEGEVVRCAGELEAAAEAIAELLARASDSPSSERVQFASLSDIAVDSDMHAIGEQASSLAQALLDHVDATREVAKLDEQLESLDDELGAIERAATALVERHTGLFASRGLDAGDERELRTRVVRLNAWRKLDERAHRLQGRIAEIESECEQLGQLDALDDLPAISAIDLLEQQLDELNRERERVEALEHERLEIAERIGDVEGRSRIVAQGDALELARADVVAARDRLAACRSQELLRAAKRFVLERVRAEHRRRSQPALVASARRLFARFTRNAYDFELRDDADTGLALLAREQHSGALLRLDQLSDGTRCQFWLALRLAFAFEAERGEKMPIVFDEALAHCDDERFAAIARALFALAEEGRQIIYLSSDRADAARFGRVAHELATQSDDAPLFAPEPSNAITPHRVDLAALRGLQQGGELADYEIPHAPRIPQPAGASLAEYARVLAIAPFDPWKSIEAQHLYWLLDEVDDGAAVLLHDLLVQGIETVGHLRLWREHRASTASADPRIAALEQRARILDAVLRTWRIGRARRVAREALAESGAVSDSFLDAVSAKLDEVAGRPDRLLAELDEGAVPRFRRDKIERLRDYFVERGALDEREALDSDEIALRVANERDPGPVGRRNADELRDQAAEERRFARAFAELCSRSQASS